MGFLIVSLVILIFIVGGAFFLLKKNKKKEKKKDGITVTVNTDGQCVDCDGKVIPEPPCVDCDIPQEPSIKVSLKPNNPPEVPAGVFCTRTLSIQAVEEIVGQLEGRVVIREWFDNDILRETGTTLLTGFFGTKHKIKYRLTVGITIIEKEIIVT